MTAATLFSGIGAPEVAMPDWDWIWHAEIEKFPSAVMRERHPSSANMGDVTAHDFITSAIAIGRPDVLVFGSPCQSYSVAGKRLGLDDPRGNLALVALGIIDALRPAWFVFENVPGLLSSWSGMEATPPECVTEWDSDETSDFAAFMGTVQDIGYSGAWAVLDAQFAGLAQRRDRLFFVGCLGAEWRRAAAVLLEPESLCGHPPTREQAREDVTGALGAGSTRCGSRIGHREAAAGQLVTGALDASVGGVDENDAEQSRLIAQKAFGGNNQSGAIDVATARSSSSSPHGRLDFASDTFIVAGTLNSNGKAAGSATQQDAESDLLIATVAYAIGSHAGCADGDQTNRSHAAGGPVGMNISEELGYSVRASRPQAVAFQSSQSGVREVEAHATLDANNGSRRHNGVMVSSGVRRLMPIECERLQGFPDHYTAISYNGKPAKDGPRYKAIGNSMAVPVIRWILQRVAFVHQLAVAS